MKSYADFIVNLSIATDNALKVGREAIDAYNGENALDADEVKETFAHSLDDLHDEGKDNLIELDKAMDTIKDSLNDYVDAMNYHPHSVEWLFYDNVPF